MTIFTHKVFQISKSLCIKNCMSSCNKTFQGHCSVIGMPKERLQTPDTILPTHYRFLQCNSPNKVDLTIGAYKDANGASYVMKVVRKVEILLSQDTTQNKDYLPMDGLSSLVSAALKLIYGEDSKDIQQGLIQGVQSVSGTGAVRLALELLTKYQNVNCVYHPSPTWPVHLTAPQVMKITDIRHYDYYDHEKSQVNWNEISKTLNEAPERSAIIFHGCGNNPTGSDFSKEQWDAIGKILKERSLIPILDLAYMGFASGDIVNDVYAPRLFTSMGIEGYVCLSFSKNFTLYNERIGVLAWYSKEKNISNEIKDRLCYEIRNMYSGPPAHGAKITSRILNDPELRKEWNLELIEMSGRIRKMREGLYHRMQTLKTPGDWSFILNQRGLFTFTRLTKKQIEYLEKEKSVYMVDNGRINVSALSNNNIDYVANSIHEAVTKIQ